MVKDFDLNTAIAEHRAAIDSVAEMEPALLALPDGKLIMHVRTADDASPGSPGRRRRRSTLPRSGSGTRRGPKISSCAPDSVP